MKEDPSSKAAFRQLGRALGMAETRALENGSTRDKLYFEALRDFVVQDYPSARRKWATLQNDEAAAEEIQWFFEGPGADAFRKASEDPRWSKAAEAFLEGWHQFQSGERAVAAENFRKTLVLQPAHAWAPAALAECQKKESAPNTRRTASFHSEMEFKGSAWQRVKTGEAEFLQGRWSAALAWFESAVAHDPDGPAGRAAKREVQRLSWMFGKTKKQEKEFNPSKEMNSRR
jgi:tetratricopeptide (TPR) repeat protein